MKKTSFYLCDAISELEIDEIVFVNQRDCKFHFKITFKVFHTSSTVTSSAFEDVDKITKKMFECNPSSSLIYGPTFKIPTFMTMTFFFAMTNPFFAMTNPFFAN